MTLIETDFINSAVRYLAERTDPNRPTDAELECLLVGFLMGAQRSRISLEALAEQLEFRSEGHLGVKPYRVLYEFVKAEMVLHGVELNNPAYL